MCISCHYGCTAHTCVCSLSRSLLLAVGISVFNKQSVEHGAGFQTLQRIRSLQSSLFIICVICKRHHVIHVHILVVSLIHSAESCAVLKYVAVVGICIISILCIESIVIRTCKGIAISSPHLNSMGHDDSKVAGINLLSRSRHLVGAAWAIDEARILSRSIRSISRQFHNHLLSGRRIILQISSRSIQHLLQLSPASRVLRISRRASTASVLCDIEHRLVRTCRFIGRDTISTVELVCTDIHGTVLDTVGEVCISLRQVNSFIF